MGLLPQLKIHARSLLLLLRKSIMYVSGAVKLVLVSVHMQKLPLFL